MLELLTASIQGAIFGLWVDDAGGLEATFLGGRLIDRFGLPEDPQKALASFIEKVIDEDRQGLLDSIRGAVKTGGPSSFEGRFQKAPGECVWFQWLTSPAREAGGSIACLVLDIDERKSAEMKHAAESRLYDVLSQVHNAVIMAAGRQDLFEEICRIAVDLGGFSAAFVSIVDRDAKKLVCAASSGIDPTVFEPEAAASYEELGDLGSVGVSVRERRVVLTGGSEAKARLPWCEEDSFQGCEWSASSPILVKGEAVGAITLCVFEPRRVDDTAQKLVSEISRCLSYAVENIERQAGLAEAEKAYRTMFEKSPQIVALCDLNNRYVDVNDRFLESAGRTREEVLGKTPSELGMRMDAACELALNNEFQKHGSLDQFEARIWSPGFDCWTDNLISSKIIQVKGAPLVLSMINDITDLKHSERERTQIQEQFMQAQKMESIGRLAGGVAHDFNNMLSVIIGTTEMVMRRLDPSDQLYKALNNVFEAGLRSADLTRQLLAFARKQAVKPRLLNLNKEVPGLLKMMKRLLGEHIEVVWHPGDDLWNILMDPSQVDQILANLAINARDAIVDSGTIVIETSNTVCDELFGASHREYVPGDYVVLAVSDNGTGMDKAVLSHIFEPFFTTKTEGTGTGLGLATVYGIVKQNGGFVNVYSEPGQGTTFRIYIPRSRAGISDADDKLGEAAMPRGSETILIVEDEESVLALGTAMLEELGYRVLAASRPSQALALAKSHSARIDLLVTDVVMQEMNGKELAERLESLKPGIKCLFMSGHTADVIAVRGILDDNINFIAKPFSMKELSAKVRDVLDGKELRQ